MFAYYLGLFLQTTRVWRLIGHCPIRFSASAGGPAAALVWPLPVLAWAHCPGCLRGVPCWSVLENWPVRLAGLLSLCAAAALWTTAYAELGGHWRIGIDPEAPPGFVTAGVYASFRHPVYTAFWLSLLGVFLMAPNLLFAMLWAGGASLIARQAAREEAHLAERFGKAYKDYANRTGRFFPLWY